MKSQLAIPLAAILAAAGAPSVALPQSPRGRVEIVQVYGRSLEGNISGDSPDRRVSVYLPPSYASAAPQRYPVLYLLQGYNEDDSRWFGRVKHFINLPDVIDRTRSVPARELIVVMPDARTRFGGSMYSSHAA